MLTHDKRDKKYLKKSRIFEIITFLVDLNVIVLYLLCFLRLFSLMNLAGMGYYNPETGKGIPPEVENNTYTVQGWLRVWHIHEINLWLSLLAIFLVVSIPLLVTSFKRFRRNDEYEYNKWTCGGLFINGLANLLILNPFSAALRFVNTFITMKYVCGYGFVGFWKAFAQSIRKLWARITTKKEKNSKDIHEESAEIRKRLRVQTVTKTSRYILTYLFLGIFAAFFIIPFYWMILTALKSYSQSNNVDISFTIPLQNAQWVNIKYVLEELNFGRYMRNTIFVGVVSTLGTLVTTILSAFAFARLDFKGKGVVFSILLMTMMIPGELYVITNFQTVSRDGLGWVGIEGQQKYFVAMIVPFLTSVSYIFFLRQTFMSVPDSLYKAAKIDGCTDFKYLLRVMVPIGAPTIMTITILSIIGSWNAYVWPQMMTTKAMGSDAKDYWLVSVALRETSFVTGGGGADGRPMYNLQIAASAIVTMPMLIVFLALRKYIMNGVGRSGTKG